MPRFIPPDEWISEGVKPGELSEQTLFNDYWDRKILDKSLISISDFAAARDELADAVPTGGPAMSDTFWALLKAIPRVLDNGAIRPSHLVNAMVMDEALQLPELQRLRHLSVNDDVQAALSAAELEPDIESLFDKLSEEQKKADELQELLQGLAATLAGIAADEADLAAMPGGSAPNQSDGEGNGEGDGEGAGQDALTDEEKEALNAKAEAIAEAKAQADELRQQAEAAAQELGDSLEEASATVSVDLSRALDKAATSADNLRQSALAWGLSPGELQRMDAKERLELARTLQSDRFRRIADRWGPMHSLALSEQARKSNHVPEEIYDTELGNHLGRILPSELIALHHPLLRKNFLRKYVSRGLMQYAIRGTEKLSRGGIIFCEDGSGSMSGEREIWAKAVMLCLLDLAKRQKREMHVIHFGSPNQYRHIEFGKPGDFTFQRIVEAAELFFNGGTDFETPMKVSLDILRGQFSRTGAVRADVVFITDDECYVRDAFMEEYLGEMHRMQATTWGISAAGGIRKGGALDQMCEGKTCQVKDFLSGEDVRHVFRGV